MAGLNFRGSKGLTAIIAQAQGTDDGNQSAAIRALILLGADRLGYDLSAVQHEIIMLMMEQVDPMVIEELHVLIGGVPRTLPKRPARERATREAPASRRRAAREHIASRVPAEHLAPPPAPVAAYHAAGSITMAGAPPADLTASSGRYDVGEEI
jgi:hypothetical protein